MVTNATLERLAWVSCGGELERRSRRWYDQISRVMGARRTSLPTVANVRPSLGSELTRDRRRHRLAALQFAVGDMVGNLTDDERRRLRSSGSLPPTFVDAVLSRAKLIEREMRASW